MKLIYTAHSKHYFFFRTFISQHVLSEEHVPLNPFMLFEYFLLDTVKRDKVRSANNTIVERCDEVWVYGPISDGVLAEIRLAHEHGKPLRYFTIENSQTIREIEKEAVTFEEDLEQFRSEL